MYRCPMWKPLTSGWQCACCLSLLLCWSMQQLTLYLGNTKNSSNCGENFGRNNATELWVAFSNSPLSYTRNMHLVPLRYCTTTVSLWCFMSSRPAPSTAEREGQWWHKKYVMNIAQSNNIISTSKYGTTWMGRKWKSCRILNMENVPVMPNTKCLLNW